MRPYTLPKTHYNVKINTLHYSASTSNNPPSRPRFLKNWICWVFLLASLSSFQNACPTTVVGTMDAMSIAAANLGKKPKASKAPPITIASPLSSTDCFGSGSPAAATLSTRPPGFKKASAPPEMKILASKSRPNDRIIVLHFLSLAAYLNMKMVTLLSPYKYRTFLMKVKFHSMLPNRHHPFRHPTSRPVITQTDNSF